ncbi:hypothetical protein ACFLSY_10025, partial [Bacteroidota bacterium]
PIFMISRNDIFTMRRVPIFMISRNDIFTMRRVPIGMFRIFINITITIIMAIVATTIDYGMEMVGHYNKCIQNNIISDFKRFVPFVFYNISI